MSPWSVHGSDGLPTQSRSKRTRFTVSLNGDAEIGPAPRSSLMRARAVAALHGGLALGEQGLMKLTTRGSFMQVSPAGHSASPSDGMPHAWVVVMEQNPCCVMKKLPLQNAPALVGSPTAAARSATKPTPDRRDRDTVLIAIWSLLLCSASCRSGRSMRVPSLVGRASATPIALRASRCFSVFLEDAVSADAVPHGCRVRN